MESCRGRGSSAGWSQNASIVYCPASNSAKSLPSGRRIVKIAMSSSSSSSQRSSTARSIRSRMSRRFRVVRRGVVGAARASDTRKLQFGAREVGAAAANAAQRGRLHHTWRW